MRDEQQRVFITEDTIKTHILYVLKMFCDDTSAWGVLFVELRAERDTTRHQNHSFQHHIWFCQNHSLMGFLLFADVQDVLKSDDEIKRARYLQKVETPDLWKLQLSISRYHRDHVAVFILRTKTWNVS